MPTEQIHSHFSIEQILFNRLVSVPDNEAAYLFRLAQSRRSRRRGRCSRRRPRAGCWRSASSTRSSASSPDGLTSRQIVDVFETRGIRFSEATLRKYVQLGLLPRSVRVGRKGKHRGSCGLYPAHVIRRVNVVKGMMAEDRTIEEIQRSFARFKDDIESVEKKPARADRRLRARSEGARRRWPTARRELEREIIEAKRAAGELVRRIASLERRISAHVEPVGGGSSAGGRERPVLTVDRATDRGGAHMDDDFRRSNDRDRETRTRRNPRWRASGARCIRRGATGAFDRRRSRPSA